MAKSPIKDTVAKFGSPVKAFRNRQGISQEELACSGLHRTYVTDVERGVRNVSLETITKIAHALEIPLVELLENIEKKPVAKGLNTEGSGKQVSILLIEDNPKHVELTLQALQRNGVTNRVLVAHSAEEALKILFDEEGEAFWKPDIIMLDLTLPQMNGLDFLRRIRGDTRTRSISVVVLTASKSDQDYKESMKLGVAGYITKPVDFFEFGTVMPKIGFRRQRMEQV